MKWFLTADWHLGISAKHNQDVMNGCKEIKEYSDKNKIPLRLINAGDIFNNPKPHPDNYEVFNECMKILDPVEHITFSGNHDKNTSTDAFTTYKPDILNILYHMIESNKTFSIIGYESVEDFGMLVQEKYDELETKGKILITHTDIPGAALGSEREIQLGAVGTLPVMKGLKFIISGHIHKHQSGIYGGVPYLYPGSLARVSHTEENQPKGFVIFDDETLNWEFIERKTDRKWVTIDVNWKGQLPKSVLNKKADVVRIRLTADSKYRGQINLADIKKQLPFEQSKISVSYETQEKLDDKVIESGSISEYEKEWIDKNVVKNKAEVKKKLREVLTDVADKDMLKTVEGLTLTGLISDNFQSLKSVRVQFNPDDCIGILGMVSGEVTKSNGVGKSSFVELIRWILFGTTRYSKAIDAIRDEQDHMFGELHFVDKTGNEIEIRRELDISNKSVANVYVGSEIKAKGAAETNKWVIVNLGLTQKAFDTIVYIGNTSVKDFISASPSERLTLMQEPIDLDKYKKAEKVFKSDLKLVSTRLTELKGAISVHEEFLKDTDIKQLKSDEAEYTDNIKDYKKKLSTINLELKKLDESITLLDNKEKLESDLKECLSDISDTEKEIKELSVKIQTEKTKRDDLKTLQITQKTYEVSIQNFSKQLDELRHTIQMYQLLKDNSECPVCTTVVTDKKRNEQAKKIKELTDKGLKIKPEHDKLIKQNTEVLQSIKQLENDLIRLESDKKDHERLKIDLQELKAESQQIKINMQKIDVKLRGIDKKNIKKQSQQLHKEFDEIESKLEDTQEDLTSVKAEILQYNEYTAKLKLNQAEYKKKQVELEVLSFCVSAVNNKGIPKFVVLQLIDQLNDSISQIIQDFNFWQVVDIYLEPDLQKDSVSIYCSVENREYREYEGLSAGERVIVNLSLRQAYKQVLETLRDIDHPFVILDEALDKLDYTNLNAVISYFKRKKMQSLCISHNDLKDTFTRTIFVKSENGVSVI